MDIDAINLVGKHGHHRPGDTFAADFVVQPFALRGGAGFRVSEAVDAAIGMQDDRAGHDGTGQTAPSDLINAGHRYETVAVEAVLDVAAGRHFCHRATISSPAPARNSRWLRRKLSVARIRRR